MKAAMVALAAAVAVPVVILGALSMVGVARVSASMPARSTAPTTEALADISPELLQLYRSAVGACVGLPWAVVAGIGKVESDHGRYGGSRIAPDGRTVPPITGMALDGAAGLERIADTDGGVLDSDPIWDRAVGPFQFIPSTWRAWATDGNGDGIADPQNIYDAVPTVVRYLCPDDQLVDLNEALLRYNRSSAYVEEVLSWAERYQETAAASAVGDYALPVPSNVLAGIEDYLRPHHDYPALDLAIDVGTPVYAVTSGTVSSTEDDGAACGGTVVLHGDDGATYTYCHLSAVAATSGSRVVAGALVGHSGGTPGEPGAGNTTGPHLHLAVAIEGRAVCPQPLLMSIARGSPIAVQTAPSTGCVQGIDERSWLAT